ncbi:MAG: hypothetical protein ABIA63_05120 [bacterium]
MPCKTHETITPPAKGGQAKFYRRREHDASPFFKLVTARFYEFEQVYPERYQKQEGLYTVGATHQAGL